MTKRSTGISLGGHARRLAAALAMGLLVGACGGPADVTLDEVDAGTSEADLRRRRPRLAVSSAEVAFDDTAVDAELSVPVTITNVGRRDLFITAVDVDGAAFS